MAAAILVGVFGLASTLLGAGVSYYATSRAWRREYSAAASDDLAELHRVAWATVPIDDALILLSKVRFRLVQLGVDQPLIDEVAEVSLECSRHIYGQRDDAGQYDDAFLPEELQERFDGVRDAIVRTLSR